jgi:hypothetical protein
MAKLHLRIVESWCSSTNDEVMRDSMMLIYINGGTAITLSAVSFVIALFGFH